MTYHVPMGTKVYAYSRVSTSEQEQSGLGLEAQRMTLESEAQRRGWDRLGLVVETASGGSMTRRSLLAELLDRLDRGEAEVLVVAKLDRLARSVPDFARIMERADRHGWSLVVLDLGVDTSTPAGRMVANVIVAIAAYERDLTRQRTKDALAAKKAAGCRLGRPSRQRAEVLERIARRRGEGATLRAIAGELMDDEILTPTGRRTWTAQQIQQALNTYELDLAAA